MLWGDRPGELHGEHPHAASAGRNSGASGSRWVRLLPPDCCSKALCCGLIALHGGASGAQPLNGARRYLREPFCCAAKQHAG